MTPHSATVHEYKRPFGNQERKGLLLQLEREDRAESWGEIAPLENFSDESYEQAKAELLEELPHLLHEQWHPQYLSPSVHFGIESAILDLTLPTTSTPIAVNALLAGTPDDMRAQGRNLTGYEAVKIKVGHLNLEESIDLVEELLTLIPDEMKVRVDANQSWTFEEGMTFARSFAPDTFEYLEEPFKTFEDYIAFPFPIALDETVRLAPSTSYLSLPHLRALIIKPTLMGGCTKLVPLLREAKQKDIDFILSSSYESELGIGLLAKVASRLQLPQVPMGLDTYRLFKDRLFEETIRCNEGKLIFPQKWNLRAGCVIAHECI
ncbi:o-succinylbenzoate synthase [Simkania sp.]|uniref:o-succinylbenzoate synthase n=1 Tax=Simkania sp. TaxID=34094 RepID=UPI003B519615